jgi:hypothetical protein
MRAKRIDEIRRSDDAKGLGAIGAGRAQYAAAWRELDVIRQKYTTGIAFFVRPKAGTMGECRTHVADMLGCPVNKVVMLNPFLGEDLIKEMEEKCERMILDEAVTKETVTKDLILGPHNNHVIIKIHLTGALIAALVKIELTRENNVTNTYYMMAEPAKVNEIRKGRKLTGLYGSEQREGPETKMKNDMRARTIINEIRRDSAALRTMGVGDHATHAAWNELRKMWPDITYTDNPDNWHTLSSASLFDMLNWTPSFISELADTLDSDPETVRLINSLATFTSTDELLSSLTKNTDDHYVSDPANGGKFDAEVNVDVRNGIGEVSRYDEQGEEYVKFWLVRGPKRK